MVVGWNKHHNVHNQEVQHMFLVWTAVYVASILIFMSIRPLLRRFL